MRRTPIIPDGNTDEAIEFLERMFPDQVRHLVAMPFRGRLEAASFMAHEDEEMRRWIDTRQGEDNLYVHVNELRHSVRNKKATKADVLAARFIHVDIDDPNAEERLRNFSPPPTAVVSSGNGFHGYWKLKKPTDDLVRVEAINMAVAEALGGDNCHNCDRIMRLPGTVNIPNAKKKAMGRIPSLASVVEADWSLTYSLEDFPQGEGPEPAGPKGVVAQDPPVVPVALEEFPPSVPPTIRTLIALGDDPDRPSNCELPRYPSRSEAVFHAACELVRAGCTDEVIAGILINPAFGISKSIRERTDAARYALKQAHSARAATEEGWSDTDQKGNPRPTMRNAVTALRRLGLDCRYDVFRHRKMVSGSALAEHQGEISDDACMFLRGVIITEYRFDPRSDSVRDAINLLCLEQTYHPVREMLDGLVWDNVSRVDRWLSTYLGAEDTPLNRAIGRLFLIAAVRRIRHPGTKFDQILVLEGKQGSGKSTALKILAGPDNHSDQELLTLDAKQQMELIEGAWIYELGEVEGLSRAEVNKIKAFASRTHDRARMAYAHFSASRPRQTVFVGTTNDDKYLRDQTGNRRFWPVKTGAIDLASLDRDRDSLWAEAATLEAQGVSITLPEELWEAAGLEQEARLEEDPWLPRLELERGTAYGDVVRIHTSHLLENTLEIPPERQTQAHTKRLATLMRKLGWTSGKYRIGGQVVRGYEKTKPEDHIDKAKF